MQRLKLLLGASAALAIGMGVAQAGAINFSQIITSPIQVSVWYGTGTTDSAVPNGSPGGTNTASFMYSGPIDFVNNNSQGQSNTFGDFFGANSSGISGFTGSTSEALFLNSTMSLIGSLNPNGYNTYMVFSGTYTASGMTSLTISHDDGASFYAGGNSIAGLYSPDPTSRISNTALLTDGVNVPFDLYYVEANGAPAVLTAVNAPEPGALVMFAAGLLGIGWMLRRRKAV